MDPQTFTLDLKQMAELFGAFVAAMGAGKAGNVLWRKYANGKASSIEPITKHEMKELLEPLEEESRRQTEILEDLKDGQASVSTAVDRLTTMLSERLPPSWMRGSQ